MDQNGLQSVVASVQDRAESLGDPGHAAGTRAALVVSCPMSNCVPREPLWPIDDVWNVLGVQTLGNQTWDRHGNETDLNTTIAHLRSKYDIEAVLVVGHTRCEVLEDALERWVSSTTNVPAGIEARLDPLASLVEDGIEEGIIEQSTPIRTSANRLVEYNVVRQVAFLQRTLPASITTAGYVYDQDGVYDSFPDRSYLVALDDATAPAVIRTRLPDGTSVRVASLLH